MSGLEFFDQTCRGEIPEPPFGKLLGINLFDCIEGFVIMTLAPSEAHYNPMGCVHGGILSTLLDSVMSAAVHTSLPAGHGYLTVEIKLNFHVDNSGRLCVTGTANCVIFDAASAAPKDQTPIN